MRPEHQATPLPPPLAPTPHPRGVHVVFPGPAHGRVRDHGQCHHHLLRQDRHAHHQRHDRRRSHRVPLQMYCITTASPSEINRTRHHAEAPTPPAPSKAPCLSMCIVRTCRGTFPALRAGVRVTTNTLLAPLRAPLRTPLRAPLLAPPQGPAHALPPRPRLRRRVPGLVPQGRRRARVPRAAHDPLSLGIALNTTASRVHGRVQDRGRAPPGAARLVRHGAHVYSS